MANLPWLVRLAIFDETTPGTPPANAAAWQSQSSVQVITDSVDVSNIGPTVVADMRSQINAQGKELNLEGLREGEFPYKVYASGTGATTAAGAQVAETVLARILENALGGMHRSNSTACTAGSTTSITVTADTNFAEGGHIAWQHPTTGELYIRQLMEESSANVWELDEALPQAAANTDVIHGCTTLYIDPDVLANSNSSGRQLSYLIQFGSPAISEAETWVTMGCVNGLNGLSWPRNQNPELDISVQYANCTLPHESPPTGMTWAADPLGVAPAVVGPNGRVWMQDVGTTTAASFCLASMELTPGVPRVRVPTVTESAANMHGTCHYSVGKIDPTVSIVLENFGTDEMDDWAAGQLKAFRVQAGTQPGFCFAVSMPNAEIATVPKRATSEGNSARKVDLRAHQGNDNDDTLFTTDTALTRAALKLVLC